ncbi:MAG: PSD1 and planctomycete cytochrome C domain-containing protein [Fuerstiella sp.]
MTRLRLTAIFLFTVITPTAHAADLTRDELDFFETKIRPVLVRECYGCHSNKAGNVRGGLRLDSRELTHIGGSSGPAVVPGNLEESWLYNAITHQDYVMPPKRKLPQSVIDDFRKWIQMGAPDPRVNNIAEIRSSITEDEIQQARESFWAYQKPVQRDLPQVEDVSWIRTEIDRFVLSKLETSGLNPAGDAAAWQVLRRLSFDLVGLPPDPEQIEAFTAAWKRNPDHAVADMVDRLLAKKQFGERWGRHWLDVVRYAESTGREVNMTYPHAWRYRDYVIDSFNDDKPFDRFVQEQLAGDLLPVTTDLQWAENLVATTFLAIGPRNVNEQNRVQFAADMADEQIDATTRIFLGMSVACARCHDHKFDAIPQTDYYALAGVFRNITTYFGNPPSEYGTFSGVQSKRNSSLILLPVNDPNPYDKRYSTQELASLQQEMSDKLRAMAETRRNRGRTTGADAKNAQRNRIRMNNELATLSGKLAVVDNSGNPLSYCMGVLERDAPANAKLLVRGEIDQPAQVVQRGFPQVLCSTPVKIDSNDSGRLQLSRWIASEENPLTARVMVNRIWQHMIGQGIVTSTENFGTTGQPPSHPELLGHLAVRFIQSDWSVKSIIRDIATSRVYRMQSTFNKQYHDYDPDNALVWRANPRRLDAEAIRDAMLTISGEIDYDRPRGSEVAKAGYTRVQGGVLGNPREVARKAFETAAKNARATGGRSGFRSQFRGSGGRTSQRGRRSGIDSAMADVARQVTNQLDMENAKFRSVYLPIVRDEEPRALEVFDGADSSAITGQRESSNTANQALYMMNNRFVIQQSAAFARRIMELTSHSDEQVEYAFLLAYGRPPTSGERSAAASFIKKFAPSTSYRALSAETLSALCQSLLASAEFRYVD